MADVSTKEEVPEPNQPPVILLDNNMIQHFLSKETAPHLKPLLDEIQEIGATLAVSQVVVYEALKAIVFKEKKFQEVNSFFRDYILRFPLDESFFMDAARVHEMYGNDPNIKANRSSFSSEDIFIATTSMLQGAYILTCDGSDFPSPFFREINRYYLDYEVKSRRKHKVVYLLAPDQDVIQRHLNELSA